MDTQEPIFQIESLVCQECGNLITDRAYQVTEYEYDTGHDGTRQRVLVSGPSGHMDFECAMKYRKILKDRSTR